jgi:hypothetical protein
VSKTWRGVEAERGKARKRLNKEAGYIHRLASQKPLACTCVCHQGEGGAHHNERCSCRK